MLRRRCESVILIEPETCKIGIHSPGTIAPDIRQQYQTRLEEAL
jgi:hypothetical protein